MALLTPATELLIHTYLQTCHKHAKNSERYMQRENKSFLIPLLPVQGFSTFTSWNIYPLQSSSRQLLHTPYPVHLLFTYIRSRVEKQQWQFFFLAGFPLLLTDLWLLAVIVFTLSGSQITTSASDPTAIRPFLGYRLKILAALVLVTATNWLSSILPVA